MASQPFDPDVEVYWHKLFPYAKGIQPFGVINDCVIVKYSHVYLKLYDESNGLHKLQLWEYDSDHPIVEGNFSDAMMKSLGQYFNHDISAGDASKITTEHLISKYHKLH